MRINVPGIKDAVAGFPVKPPGEYPVEVEQYEVKTTKDGSSQYLAWTLNITDGDHLGGKLFYNTPLSEKGLGITKAFFEACGVPIEADEIEPDDCTGISLIAVVNNREYPEGSGILRDGVAGVKPA